MIRRALASIRYRVGSQARRAILAAAVRADSRSAKSRILMSPGGRGLFIDCGSNLGQGLAHFRKHFPADLYDYILVEPNPYCAGRLRQMAESSSEHIEIVEAAASSREGRAKFYGLAEDGRGQTSDGGSILRDHASAWYTVDEEKALEVQTFPLSQLIEARVGSYSAIIMKMDIEGAEYEVLEHLLETGAHRRLSGLYVEFHSQYMREPARSVYAKREADITERYRAAGLPLRPWV
jgi:FkbM family methyltransferase